MQPETLVAMAKRTRMTINCSGPFRLFGEPVVAACVAQGSHYIDICGEPEFIERMAIKYHDAAQEAGVVRALAACSLAWLLTRWCGVRSLCRHVDSIPSPLTWGPCSLWKSSRSKAAWRPGAVWCAPHCVFPCRAPDVECVGNYGQCGELPGGAVPGEVHGQRNHLGLRRMCDAIYAASATDLGSSSWLGLDR